MKHRKFVKQIMATGTDRNTAVHMAQLCQACREPYEHAAQRWQQIMREHRNWRYYFFLAGLPGPKQGGDPA